MKRGALILALWVLIGAAPARDQVYGIADFDRIRASGAFEILVETGKPTTAKANGTFETLERLMLSVEGSTLVIRPKSVGLSGSKVSDAPIIVRVTTRRLQAVSVLGATNIRINAVRSPLLNLAVQGSGSISVGQVDAEKIVVNQFGSGSIALAGKARNVQISSEGSGGFSSGTLLTDESRIRWNSAGELALGVLREATIFALGAGNVTITGKARCLVQATGAGEIKCAGPLIKPKS